MAKKTNSSKQNSQNADQATGRVMFYDELHFIKTKDKNEYWAAQVLYFNKMSYEWFIDPKMLHFYRELEAGKINEKLYREFIDPKLPDGSGGEAAYFKSNWQTCPIYMHLENIKEAQLKKLPLNIVCKAADEFSKLKQQADNDKIIGAKYMRQFLNEINPQLGIRLLKPDEDPFGFINQIESQEQSGAQSGQASPATSTPTSAIEALKAKISNNTMLAVYNEYLYKDGVEVAIEIGIDQYINVINKFRQSVLPRLIADVKNVNAHSFRHYTSTTTGRPIVDYEDPGNLKISPCRKEDLSDMTGHFKEWDIPFGEFVQMAGGDLAPETLKLIFEKNRQMRGSVAESNSSYERMSTFQRNAAKIRIGYHEFETQNMDVYADYVTKQGNKVFKKQDNQNYQPTDYAKQNYNAKRVEKHYNVWYSFYYIPLDSLFTISGTTSFTDQAKYIFKFGPIQDQMREGDDYRYAKGTLCGFRSRRFSFARIEHSYMPEIIKLWHLFQNDLSTSMSDGVIWSEEVINTMMTYVDSGKHKTPGAKKMEALRLLRQTNSGIGNFNKIDGETAVEQKLFEKVELNSLNTATKRLELIMSLYEMLTKSLGFNEITEGQSPQPRQNFGGINLAMQAGSNASYSMEEALVSSYLTLGERLMYYIKEIVDEDGDRFQEFYDMVGQANAMAAQSIKDIPLHRLNLGLVNEMTDEQKQNIMQTAQLMAKAGVIGPDQVLYLSMIDNVKYAYAILTIEIQAGQLAQQQAEVAQRQQTRDDELFTSNLKINEIRAAKAGELEVKQMLANAQNQMMVLENQLKLHGQIVTKNLINQHRTEQAIIENRLNEQSIQNEDALETHDNKQVL